MSSYRLRSAQEQTPLARRASGLGLAVGINLLVLLVLLGIGAVRAPVPIASDGLVVDFITEAVEPVAESPQKAAPKEQPKPVEPEEQAVPPQMPEPRVVLPPTELLYVPMTRAEMAASDLRTLPKAAAGEGGAGNDSEEVGRGPRGEVLYAAEWARRPTSTELGGYLPPNAPNGWGMIACKTMPGNRVDDCVEIGNDPPGSRLASAVRQAAWQFRVKPPRKNGKPMIGEWVRIRIEYTGRGG